jgi:cell division septal protein FtsQ
MAKGGGASRPRFRLLPVVVLTAAILLLPTAVYAWGRSSSSFAVRHVAATGTEVVPARRVTRLLRHDYLGRNLFTVTAKDVQRSLSSQPYVASVAVDRDFPDTLRVRITEYEPALYASSGGRWFVIGTSGRVICEQPEDVAAKDGPQKAGASVEASGTAVLPSTETTAVAGGTAPLDDKQSRDLARLVAGPPGADLPLPRMAVPEGLRPGETTRDEGVRAALSLLAGLPPSMPAQIAVVAADGPQLTLRFADGPLVAWGDSSRALAKTLALEAVLGEYEQAGKTCIFLDVSVPDRVLGRPVLK